MRRREWVILITGSTGSALRAVGLPTFTSRWLAGASLFRRRSKLILEPNRHVQAAGMLMRDGAAKVRRGRSKAVRCRHRERFCLDRVLAIETRSPSMATKNIGAGQVAIRPFKRHGEAQWGRFFDHICFHPMR